MTADKHQNKMEMNVHSEMIMMMYTKMIANRDDGNDTVPC